MLAHHYREALRLAESSGADTGQFRGPAFAALADASERAAALSSWNAAAELAAEALALETRPGLQLRLARAKAFGNADVDTPLAEAACDGYLAQDDLEGATEAEAFLGWAYWWSGDGEAARAHTERAVELARDLPTSFAKARAYARAARLDGIGGDPARGIARADMTLALAEELDDDELRSDALNSRGISKDKLDDRTAIDDLERSIELADRASSVQQMATSRNNLASTLASVGRVREAMAACEDARDVGLRFGSVAAAQWPAMQLIQNKVLVGDPGALAEAEELSQQVSPSSQVHTGLLYARGVALTLLGRFDEAEPLVERSLAGARLARDAQAVAPALAAKLLLLVLTHRGDEANVVVDEFVATRGYFEPDFSGDISLLLVELGREADWLAAAPGFRHTLWADAGMATAEGDFVRAAGIYQEIGARVAEAWARLLAAERGDLSQLEPARAFFTGYGAQPFLERCQAVLPASA